jgi:hypothetical protein
MPHMMIFNSIDQHSHPQPHIGKKNTTNNMKTRHSSLVPPLIGTIFFPFMLTTY